MSHESMITGGGEVFVVDVGKKKILKPSTMPKLAQGDHNSKRLIFSMPRYIEGHDMSKCNKCEIHYTNVNTETEEIYSDVYKIKDVSISEADEQQITFSWLISDNATKYWGGLCFSLKFGCVEEGKTVYEWNTITFASVPVYPSKDNMTQIVSEHPDIMTEMLTKIERFAIILEDLNMRVELPDWDIKSPTEAGYINNKPFYIEWEEDINETFILTKDSCDEFDEEGYYSDERPIGLLLENTYTVLVEMTKDSAVIYSKEFSLKPTDGTGYSLDITSPYGTEDDAFFDSISIHDETHWIWTHPNVRMNHINLGFCSVRSKTDFDEIKVVVTGKGRHPTISRYLQPYYIKDGSIGYNKLEDLPDYKVNTPSEAGYIFNRPFYETEEFTGEEAITVEFDFDGKVTSINGSVFNVNNPLGITTYGDYDLTLKCYKNDEVVEEYNASTSDKNSTIYVENTLLNGVRLLWTDAYYLTIEDKSSTEYFDSHDQAEELMANMSYGTRVNYWFQDAFKDNNKDFDRVVLSITGGFSRVKPGAYLPTKFIEDGSINHRHLGWYNIHSVLAYLTTSAEKTFTLNNITLNESNPYLVTVNENGAIVAERKGGDGTKIVHAPITGQALSPYSTAFGYNTIAGIMGYYYSDITFNDDGTAVITLTDNQDKIENADISVTYTVGDIISLVNDTKYPDCATITAVNGNKIAIDQLPFTSVVNVTDPAMDDYSLYVIEKPTIGVVPLGYYANASGEECIAIERASYARGRKTRALGQYASTEGRQTEAQYCGHAENYKTKATGFYSHAEGRETEAIGDTSHVEGYKTKATGQFAHAQNFNTEASGYASTAMGRTTKAVGENSLALGNETKANGKNSLASGTATEANGKDSSVMGYFTRADSDCQSVRGRFNEIDSESKYVDIVGNGANENSRSNAYTLSFAGDGWFKNSITSYSLYIGNDNTVDYTCGAIGSWNTVYNADIDMRYAVAFGHKNDVTVSGASAMGLRLNANGEWQHVVGKDNVADADKAFIIGNGADINHKSNAHTVDWDGNAFYAGEVECSAVVMKSPSGKKFRITVDDDGTLTTTAVD